MSNRVIIFSTAYWPLVGGAEVALSVLTKLLADYEFVVITARLDRSLPRKQTVDNVTIYRLGLGWFFDKYWLALFGHRLANKLHYQNQFDLIWVMMASFGALSAVRFKKNIPMLLTLQEGDDLGRLVSKTKIIKPWFNQIFKQADHIQCISNYLANWVRQLNPSVPVSVIPNGVDFSVFNSNNKLRDKFSIVTTSRLVYKNGIDTLIKALSFLPPQFKLIIIGDGPDKNKLIKLTSDLNLSARVSFLGSLNQTKIVEYLNTSGVFVRVSRSEGLGNSFLEAMACDLPVIGTPVGGIVDFLVDNKTGWLVNKDNEEELALKIKWVVDNPERVKQVTNEARVKVVSEYDWKTIALRLRDIFGFLIKNE